MKTLATDNAH